MRLFHTTSRRLIRSICKDGLLTRYATRRRAAVWVHEGKLSMWAFLHVGQSKKFSLTDMACIELDIPRSWLRRYSDGVYYVMQDVPADRIRAVRYYGVVKEERRMQ